MNREIKFRVWDTYTPNTTRKMRYDIENIKCVGGEIVGVRFIDNKFKEDFTGTKYIEIMQYTGLKDKNGKEIYEGDILETENYGRITVGWCNAGFSPFSSEGFTEIGMVIGNKYENPELLNKPTSKCDQCGKEVDFSLEYWELNGGGYLCHECIKAETLLMGEPK